MDTKSSPVEEKTSAVEMPSMVVIPDETQVADWLRFVMFPHIGL